MKDVIVTKEELGYVATDTKTGIASQGKTPEEAKKALKEALELSKETEPHEQMMSYRYRNSAGKECVGRISLIRDVDPMEMEIEANGWTFHTIVGRHQNGNYICIPNWNIGSELAYLQDEFWNYERLCNYTALEKDNALAITKALAEVDKRIKGTSRC